MATVIVGTDGAPLNKPALYSVEITIRRQDVPVFTGRSSFSDPGRVSEAANAALNACFDSMISNALVAEDQKDNPRREKNRGQ